LGNNRREQKKEVGALRKRNCIIKFLEPMAVPFKMTQNGGEK
jgi:hypothetical protein